MNLQPALHFLLEINGMSKTKLFHVTGESHVGISVVYYFVLVAYLRGWIKSTISLLITIPKKWWEVSQRYFPPPNEDSQC